MAVFSPIPLTPIKLIQSYGSVENVLDHIESLTPGQQKKIATDKAPIPLTPGYPSAESPINALISIS
jgi:uncharacterized protein (DUF2249 family)